MFYLTVFFKSISENIFKGIIFILFTATLILSLVGQKDISKILQKKLSHSNNLTYFYALISAKENYNTAIRKIRALQEVKKIETVSSEILAKEVRKILGELDVEILNSLWSMNYIGLKIVFRKGVSLKAQNLIREYLTRLVGEDNLMLGAIRNNKLKQGGNRFLPKLSRYSYPILILILAIIWIISFLLLRSSLLKVTYLIEQYQRRKNVLLKTLALGLLSLLILFGILGSIVLTPNYLNLVGAFLLMLLAVITGLKKYAWEV